MKRSTFTLFIVTLVVSLFFCTSSVTAAPDKIVFGQALALSGPHAQVTGILEQAAIKVWLKQVNAKGGIYVKEYGKRLPVELLQYDNKSDVDTCVKLVKKLITVDKVDFLLPPWGSTKHYAVLPVANKYGHPIVAWTTTASTRLVKMMSKLPYIFIVAPPPDAHMKVAADLYLELGVKKAAILYLQDLAGIEYSKALEKYLTSKGVEIAIFQSYPPMPTDLSPLLKKVKSAGVDALIGITYPGDSVLLTEQSMVIGLNPKVFAVGIGGAMPFYRDKFGSEKLEGVIAFGGWDPDATAESRKYFDNFKDTNGFEPDYYSGPWGYATYQIYEQAIEKAGTLDRKKVRDILASETFTNTSDGSTVFKFDENRLNYNISSYMGQWQGGIFKALAPKETRNSKPVYPKPQWK